MQKLNFLGQGFLGLTVRVLQTDRQIRPNV